MPTPALFPIDWHQFEHIVLDFGGVLYEIDHNRTTQAFAKLGIPDFDLEFRHGQQSAIFSALETGHLEEREFLTVTCAKGANQGQPSKMCWKRGIHF